MPNKVVQVPGIGNVEFPDSMSDDQISATIKGQLSGQAAAPNAGLAPPTDSIPPLGTLPKPVTPYATGNDDFVAKTMLRGLNAGANMVQHPIQTLTGSSPMGLAANGAVQSYQDLRNFLKTKQMPTADDQVNRITGQLGIDAPAVREAAQNHDYGQLAAETAVPVGMALIGGKLGKKISPNIPAPQTQVGSDNMIRLLDPTKTEDGSILPAVERGMPGLTDVARTSNPRTVSGLAKAITTKQAELESTFQQVKAPVAHQMVDATPIGQAILQEIKPGIQLDRPELAAAIRAEADKYLGQRVSVDTLDSLRRTLNDDLSAQYKKAGLSASDARNSPDYGYQFAKADAARDLLYDSVQKATGQDLTPIKQMQSNLRTIQGKLEAVNDANKIADAKNRATTMGERTGQALEQFGNFKPGTAVKVGVGKYLSRSRSANATVGRFSDALGQSQTQPAVPVVGSLAARIANDQQ